MFVIDDGLMSYVRSNMTFFFWGGGCIGSRLLAVFSGCMETYRRVHVVPGGRKGTENTHKGHTTHILSMAISTDNKYLVSTAGTIPAVASPRDKWSVLLWKTLCRRVYGLFYFSIYLVISVLIYFFVLHFLQ